jgi:hypothetical protein
MYPETTLIIKIMRLVKIATLLSLVTLFACNKDEMRFENFLNDQLHKEIMVPELHNTSTTVNNLVADDEVVFSFILSSSIETKDAVVYYSVDNHEYDQSLYLKKEVNIADHGFDEGLFTNGVKAVMKSFNLSQSESRKYYFKIIRLSEVEKYTYFGIEVLPCGNVILTDDSLKSNQFKPTITYYIRTENNIVEYINVRIE